MKTNTYWCRGSDSNRYGTFIPQDFKSFRAVLDNHRNTAKSLCYSAFRAVLDTCLKYQITRCSRHRVSRLSANFCLCPDCLAGILNPAEVRD